MVQFSTRSEKIRLEPVHKQVGDTSLFTLNYRPGVAGISWLSYIPAILIRNNVFDASASVLVACQGVYIMLAFVCNIIVLLKAYVTERRKLSVNSSISDKMHKAQKQTFVVNKESGTTTALV